MSCKTDFKTVTLTFNRDNKDVKQKLINLIKTTGKSKVDILADALRQYDPNKNPTNNSIDKETLKELMKEILSEEGINLSNQDNQEYELDSLNNKKLDNKFFDDDE